MALSIYNGFVQGRHSLVRIDFELKFYGVLSSFRRYPVSSITALFLFISLLFIQHPWVFRGIQTMSEKKLTNKMELNSLECFHYRQNIVRYKTFS